MSVERSVPPRQAEPDLVPTYFVALATRVSHPAPLSHFPFASPHRTTRPLSEG
jgi:hypothetical protein